MTSVKRSPESGRVARRFNATCFRVLAVIAGALSASTLSYADTAPPSKAPYLTSSELKSIYSGNTWVWPTGGAYFNPNGVYVAVADTGYAQGRWKIERWGKVCTVSNWYGKKKVYKNIKSCFEHVKWDGLIYQRKSGAGWYVFGHSPPRKEDQISKFRKGDTVSSRLPKT